MTEQQRPPALRALDEALAHGDMEGFRRRFFALGEPERNVLELRLGRERVEHLYARARRRRGARQGRVLVLHGIMGSELETVERDSDEDLIWISYVRLALGRLARLTLTLDGEPADPRYSVKLGGLLTDYYLPLIVALDNRWDVRPFAFDWRIDIDASARRLAHEIEEWAKGEPAHIVAHSMGGLVARRLIQLFPDLWKSMADPDGRRRGGRLVMLGTPNRGSLEIPLVLTGEQQTVKMLAALDLPHDLSEVLEIIGTFLGSYQMLPSPKLDLGDDRARLFDDKTWGRLPIHQRLLDGARALQEHLHPVIDPDRLVYVAGYDQETVYRIHVNGPGRFSYQKTLDGDGTVPHELGLLPGVRTFWVKEVHGDLPKNDSVLAGIDDLLATGATAALEPERPARRAVDAPRAWVNASEIDPVPPEFEALCARARRRRAGGAPALGPREAAELESLLVRPFLGGPRVARAIAGPSARRGPARPATTAKTPRRRLQVEVAWGDITRAPGDVYAVGHYQGVLPQFAELALDKVVSAARAGAGRGAGDDLVLTSLSRRGVLRGTLGDVDFYPWAERPERIVAVAGMGHPGRFGPTELRLLARNLTWAITSLPRIRTVCTVLIGSGAGNLTIPAALRELFTGMVEAMERAEGAAPIERVRMIEKNLAKAHQIQRDLARLLAQSPGDSPIELVLAKDVRVYPNGSADGLALALAAAVDAIRGPARSPSRRAIAAVLRALPVKNQLRQTATRTLEALAKDDDRRLERLAASLEVSRISKEPASNGSAAPTRMSFVTDGKNIRVAALTETAVIPEREIGVDPELVDEAIQSTRDPEPARLSGLSALLGRLLVPRDFRDLLHDSSRPIVFELDRAMARVHWEMLSAATGSETPAEAISINNAFARQLRTAYSPAPTPDARRPGRLRALVVGDPGDPRKGHHLPGAQREAIEVAKLLEERYDVEVLAMIGAPSAERTGPLGNIAPASRLAVLDQLMHGGFDLLHYCGHGDFDRDDPTMTGWVFEGGLLTARELERVDVAPRLVVANACLSGLTSDRLARGQGVAEARSEANLLPSLADEFFLRGVRNYIGTAWEIDDVGAVEFATHLYDALLGSKVTLGEAIRRARANLQRMEQQFGALWAAYQHYGDPTFPLSRSDASLP